MRPDWRGTWQLGRAIVCGAASVVLAAGALAATAGTASSTSPGPSISEDKIRPKLSTQLESRDAVDFWIYFDDKPDLTEASAIESWDERGAAVAEALRQAATSSQQAVRQQLTEAGVEFQTFWATNAIKVSGGTQELAERLATRVEVDSLWPTFKVTPPTLETSPSGRSTNAVEWGIANINADDVWEQYEVTGEDLVIANIDSGVQYDHPALVDHYRGNNGDGTFDHDYNWFDAANLCDEAPCDRDGHGTHTMGTMVGDDGAGNQIGVAPGATWIAANGCCPSDAALIASGQWMLEPTDLNGENPDASMRPNIINNSWGTELPSTAPFMEDISQAWTASGIFGVWSNGNNGSSCRTSGSPGSRIINYSVGAYDADNGIAESSSRGAGQDGETKPNISAPGVNVRSSVPGNGYASYDGTSMAAPHVAGAIALLWSASPALTGDVATTRDLLDGTATDHADDQCGGTADDNNVFGEGQLDALALVNAAPTGETGTLAGTVTDAETGDPIAGATVSIAGALPRELETAADGTYSTLLPAGDHTVTVSAYRYVEQTRTATVTPGDNTLDLALEPVESVTISGKVLDGSGHGWPLYAKVTVNGDTTLSDYTDPETGTYEIKVPTGTTWTLEVESRYDGYETATAQIEAGSSNVVHNVDLPVDAGSCTAAGYEHSPIAPVVSEDFNAGTLPDGWTVEDHLGDGRVWRFDNPRNRSNRTGGDGAFAILDSEGYFLSSEDSSLVTPSMDLRDAESVVVQFNQHYDAHRNDELAVVGASVDGGATWQTMHDQTGDSRAGPRVTTVAVPSAAGEAEVKVRWRYRGFFGYYWQIDDVVVGTRTCDPVDAGLLVGQVRDRNTDAALAGALVTNVDNPDQVATTMATPDDPALDDGFWWMVSELTGERQFSVAAEEYQTQTSQVSVRAGTVTPTEFRLAAGRLTVDKSELRSSLLLGGSASRTFTVTNDGTAPAQIELSGRDGTFEMLGGGADTTSSLRQLDSAPAAATRARQSKPSESSASAGPEDGSGFGPSGLEAGRSNLPTVPKAAADDVTITHSVSQELMVNSVSCTGGGTTSAAGFLRVFDLEDFDIETDFEVKSISFGVEAARGTQRLSVNLYTLDGELVYDNLTPIGSAETTLQPQELTIVSVPVTGTAPAGSTLVVEIDSPDLGAIGAAFFPGSNNLGQTGPTYLRAADCGVPEPVPTDTIGRPDMHLVLNVTGEADSSMPWLSLDPETVRLAPGQSAQIRVTMDGQVDQPGTYAGRIRLAEDTPYGTPSVGATMNITPPRTWGKIVGTVTGTSCDGDTTPIAEATVQVDWRSGYRTLYTDGTGEYAYWLDQRGNPYTFVAAKDGYRPLVRTVRVVRGQTRTESFALQETRC